MGDHMVPAMISSNLAGLLAAGDVRAMADLLRSLYRMLDEEQQAIVRREIAAFLSEITDSPASPA